MAAGNQQTFTDFIQNQPENIRMDLFIDIVACMEDGYAQEEFELQTNEANYQKIFITNDKYKNDTEPQKKKRRKDAVRLINSMNTSIEHIMHEINNMLPAYNAPLATVDDIIGITDELVDMIEDENDDFAEANYPGEVGDGLARPYYVFFITRIRELIKMRKDLQKMVDDFNSYYARIAIMRKRKEIRDNRQLGRSRRKTRKVAKRKKKKTRKTRRK
jgi:hypothetical protein